VSTAPLDWLLSPAAIDTGLDRKMLAGLLLELARNVDPNVGTEPTGIAPFELVELAASAADGNSENSKANRIENYERSRGIWTNLFGGSKKNSEENREK
jgi:hypothetical protein